MKESGLESISGSPGQAASEQSAGQGGLIMTVPLITCAAEGTSVQRWAGSHRGTLGLWIPKDRPRLADI